MKRIILLLTLSLTACCPIFAEGIEATLNLGVSLPSSDSETGLSPSLGARIMKTFGLKKLRFGIGLSASQDLNYIRKDKPQANGSTGNGLSQSIYATAKLPVTDVDVTQTNDQDVTVNIPLPVNGVAPRILRDLEPSSIFSIAPMASLGYEIGDFFPYLVTGAGLSRVTRQDGLTNWGNGYFVGVGFNYELGNDWFCGAEVLRQSIDTEIATYRTNKYLAQAGKRF